MRKVIQLQFNCKRYEVLYSTPMYFVLYVTKLCCLFIIFFILFFVLFLFSVFTYITYNMNELLLNHLDVIVG